MKVDAGFELTGIEDILKQLYWLERKTRDKILVSSLKEAAKFPESLMRAKLDSHKRTGALWFAIGFKVKNYRKAGIVWAGIGPKTKQGGMRLVGKKAKMVIPTKYAHFLEYGFFNVKARRKIPARPFARPAVDESKAKVFTALRQMVLSKLEER
jgi:HK97 gp10 family phage protein